MQAWFNYEAEKKKVVQFKSGMLGDAQKVMDGMVYKYKRGETNILDVLVAQRTYNEVQQEYLETMKGYAVSLVELGKGLWHLGYTFLKGGFLSGSTFCNESRTGYLFLEY